MSSLLCPAVLFSPLFYGVPDVGLIVSTCPEVWHMFCIHSTFAVRASACVLRICIIRRLSYQTGLKVGRCVRARATATHARLGSSGARPPPHPSSVFRVARHPCNTVPNSQGPTGSTRAATGLPPDGGGGSANLGLRVWPDHFVLPQNRPGRASCVRRRCPAPLCVRHPLHAFGPLAPRGVARWLAYLGGGICPCARARARVAALER